MENNETKRWEEEFVEILNKDKTEKLKKEKRNLMNEIDRAWKNIYVERIEVYKFIIEQELKNIDVILGILKLVTSLSISIFVASLTTSYFNGKIAIIVIINIISISLLIIFIFIRNDILLKNKRVLFRNLAESENRTLKDSISKYNDFIKNN